MTSFKYRLCAAGIAASILLSGNVCTAATDLAEFPAGEPKLLTDPFLQNPTEDGVYVVWITNFKGVHHKVVLGNDRRKEGKRSKWNDDRGFRHPPLFIAGTRKIERMFEDAGSRLDNAPDEVMQRVAYRHEAYVHGLKAGDKRAYWIVSRSRDGQEFKAGPFTLQPLPQAGKPLQILLTSDQQERYNTLSNYQRVHAMFPDLDAVFFAGDLVNHPRRGSEWFDNFRSSWLDNPTGTNPSFFPAMQGNFGEFVPNSPYIGGEIMQNTPLFPAVANHEVSGRFRPNEVVEVNGVPTTININGMFGDPQPRWFAEYRYQQVQDSVNPTRNPAIREQWIRDNSNDFETYRELFTLPDDAPEGESYYSKKFGDVFLIAMNVSRIWRTWNIDTKGKFSEAPYDLNRPEEWGFGEHLFTPFAEGTPQHRWLEKTLESKAYKSSKYRIVMFHQSAHGLGDNVVPVLTDPLLHIDYVNGEGVEETRRVLMPQGYKARKQVWAEQIQPLIGSITAVRYEYPINQDYFRRDVEPLLQAAGVQLVLHGHSHIWNRAKAGDLHYLETSNVGNCFGAYWTGPDGTVWNEARRASGYASFWNQVEAGKYDAANYPVTGDPQGREPIMPTLANPMVEFGQTTEEVPFVCSNNISVFTILDTEMGAVRSFAFDATDTDSEVIEFDRFDL